MRMLFNIGSRIHRWATNICYNSVLDGRTKGDNRSVFSHLLDSHPDLKYGRSLRLLFLCRLWHRFRGNHLPHSLRLYANDHRRPFHQLGVSLKSESLIFPNAIPYCHFPFRSLPGYLSWTKFLSWFMYSNEGCYSNWRYCLMNVLWYIF